MIRVEVQRELTAAADGVWMIVAATDDEPRDLAGAIGAAHGATRGAR